MELSEKESIERSAIELIHALKRRDLDAAVAFFHPDERTSTQQMLQNGGLDSVLDDLPIDEPKFRWLNTGSGAPIINVTNSFAPMEMGWILLFRDGKWWFS